MMETYTNNTRHCCCGWIYNQEIIRNQFVTIGQRHRCGVEKKRVRVHRPCALVSKLSWKLNDFSWLDDAIHHVGNSRHFVSLVNSQRKSQSFVVDARLLYKYVSSWLLYKDEASYFLLYSLRFYSNHLIHSFLTIPQYKKIRAAISAFSAVESIKAELAMNRIFTIEKEPIRAVVYHPFSFTIQFPVVRLLTEFQSKID